MRSKTIKEREHPKEPDVECHECGKLLPISEVEHTKRVGKEPMGIPRYYCKKCTKKLKNR